MEERFRFWNNPASWPDDAYGFVFLARAMDLIGKALHPHEWTGKEPTTRPPIRQPNSILFDTAAKLARAKEDFERDIAALVASVDRSKLQWVIETTANAGRGRRSKQRQALSKDAMQFGISLLAEENRTRLEAAKRWARVVDLAKEALREGSLEYATLPVRGGALSGPHPKYWWNVPNIDHRLIFCRIDPVSPFSPGFAGDRFENIFVKKSDLEKLLPAPPKPTTSEQVKALEDRAAAVYDKLKAENGGRGPGIRQHEKACKAEGIKSTPARRVWDLKSKSA
ncbi:hypothetical protein [Agrobacterium cavarae]|mgnify:CR=1 FL=1|uniref:hypothetical protein n=1 Tax=Agrobacterium cavarae TaxID=2528239 RepID=UPI002FDA9351